MPLSRLAAVTLLTILSGLPSASSQAPPANPQPSQTEPSDQRAELVRPDRILQALESADSSVRCDAVLDLGRCHAKHPNLIPGAIESLRRSANDPSFDVALASVQSAGLVGSFQAFGAITDALRRPLSATQAGLILDAIDAPTLRPFWKTSDPFRVSAPLAELRSIATREHTLEALAAISIPPASPAVINSGREAFVTARCDACHRVAGYGRAAGPDLRGIGMCYSNTELIRHILQPSIDLHDVGRFDRFLTVDGRVITGHVVSSESDQLHIQTDLSNPDSVVILDPKEVEQRSPSTVSPMPLGLLNSLTPTQVAELVTFLRSDGGQLAPPDASHEH
ncbi:putative transmembrane protein [Rhodopirellula islandica]|uniref:Transmembrane protein n=1 Tax=Rhodopirellula islandica TaxID=595434 RepID=A0A0J1E7S3_RHOIS|nr:c-type cytochrome [Rhodopirellula islandica]KLU01534.1 putative transmembrane protein [Rhodopirellula islandica]